MVSAKALLCSITCFSLCLPTKGEHEQCCESTAISYFVHRCIVLAFQPSGFIGFFLKGVSCPLLVKQVCESGQLLTNNTHLGSGDIKKEAYRTSVRLRMWDSQCCPALASLPPSGADLYPPKRMSQSCLFLEIP